jgi:hypothetical protein
LSHRKTRKYGTEETKENHTVSSLAAAHIHDRITSNSRRCIIENVEKILGVVQARGSYCILHLHWTAYFGPTLFRLIEMMKLAGFLGYTIATFSSAGSSFWNHHNAQFSVALPDQTQDIL